MEYWNNGMMEGTTGIMEKWNDGLREKMIFDPIF